METSSYTKTLTIYFKSTRHAILQNLKFFDNKFKFFNFTL